jgi:hypothetical protein
MSKVKTIVLLAGVAVIAAMALPSIQNSGSSGVASSSGDTKARQAGSDVEDCVNKGISYYQKIGSYPKLSDGRIAVDVARERCRNTPRAFD